MKDVEEAFEEWFDEAEQDDFESFGERAWKAGYDFRKSQEKRTCLSGPDEWFMKSTRR